MELVNDFTVNVPVGEAWTTLTDVERIAPCLPGAQLQEIEGDTFRGVVKVKVGPILAQFKGQAQFVEKDDVNHKAVLKAEGRDTGGKGNASAMITAQLTAQGDATTYVQVTTDLTITGKVAQFGRGAMADISNKLLRQFVENLETMVLVKDAAETTVPAAAAAAGSTAAAPTSSAATSGSGTAAPSAGSNGSSASTDGDTGPTVRKIEQADVAPLDLAGVAGGAMLKRLLPLVGVVGLLLLVFLRRRRR